MSFENNESPAWKSRWSQELKLSAKSEYVLITDGSYDDNCNLFNGGKDLPFWVGGFHSANTPSGFRQYRMSEDPNHTINQRIKSGDERIDAEPKPYVFVNVVHFDIYQLETLKDKDGKVLVSKYGDNAGEDLKGYKVVESIKARKKLANEPDESTSFYRKRFLKLTVNQHSAIWDEIHKMKSKCLCGGKLTPLAYSCPECEEIMVTDENLKVSELTNWGDNERRCPHCRVSVLPVPIVECSKCEEPRPYGFDQIVVELTKTGSGLQTKVKVESVTTLDDFRLHNGEAIIEQDADGKPIIEDGRFIYTEEIEYLADNAYDFDSGNPVVESSKVSDDFNLNPGDAGYVAGSMAYGTKKSVQPQRRRWR